jgi:hypothetical protein
MGTICIWDGEFEGAGGLECIKIRELLPSAGAEEAELRLVLCDY